MWFWSVFKLCWWLKTPVIPLGGNHHSLVYVDPMLKFGFLCVCHRMSLPPQKLTIAVSSFFKEKWSLSVFKFTEKKLIINSPYLSEKTKTYASVASKKKSIGFKHRLHTNGGSLLCFFFLPSIYQKGETVWYSLFDSPPTSSSRFKNNQLGVMGYSLSTNNQFSLNYLIQFAHLLTYRPTAGHIAM